MIALHKEFRALRDLKDRANDHYGFNPPALFPGDPYGLQVGVAQWGARGVWVPDGPTV